MKALSSFWIDRAAFTTLHIANMVAALSIQKELKAFIKSIPSSKLRNLSDERGTIYDDENFRLDMQGVRSLSLTSRFRFHLRFGHQINNDGSHNLQIQANSQAKIRAIRQFAPRTVAGPVFVKDGIPTPAKIREMFIESIIR